MAILNRRRYVKIQDVQCIPGDLLVASRQPFPDDAREILIIVGGTCAVFDKAAPDCRKDKHPLADN